MPTQYVIYTKTIYCRIIWLYSMLSTQTAYSVDLYADTVCYLHKNSNIENNIEYDIEKHVRCVELILYVYIIFYIVFYMIYMYIVLYTIKRTNIHMISYSNV